MRTSITNTVAALKRRKQENGDESGFSLIELIVVVVILGILAAIAVPVFLGLQGQAEDNARATVAANAATQTAAALAANPAAAVTASSFANLANGKYTFTVAPASGLNIGNFCITVNETGKTARTSGPGCPVTP